MIELFSTWMNVVKNIISVNVNTILSYIYIISNICLHCEYVKYPDVFDCPSK